MKRLVVCALLLASAVLAAEDRTQELAPKPATGQEHPVAPPPAVAPVLVTNFPNPQTVAGAVTVANLPAVQEVTGAVQVANLPAVQQVTGEVTISNLPQCGDPSFMVLQVPAILEAGSTRPCSDGSITCSTYTSAPFSAAGWKVVSVQIVTISYANAAARVATRNFQNDAFGPWIDLDATGTGPVRGAEAMVESALIADISPPLHFSVYLAR